MPVVCTKDHLICLWIDNGGVYASYGNSTINSSSPIAMDEWFNILYIYDESGKQALDIDIRYCSV